MSDLVKKLCPLLILSSFVFINSVPSSRYLAVRRYRKLPNYPTSAEKIFLPEEKNGKTGSLIANLPITPEKNTAIFIVAVLLSQCFQYQYLNKLAAIETSKTSSTTTKLGQLAEKYIAIEEHKREDKNPVKGEIGNQDQRIFIKELRHAKKKILLEIHRTYKQNTTLLQRIKNAFLWISYYEKTNSDNLF